MTESLASLITDELPDLEILYQDNEIIAINKPSGWFVHRSLLDPHITTIVLQKLRDQVGQYLYPVHRLDRPTSGVLLFAFTQESARHLSTQLMNDTVDKQYLAIVRGYIAKYGETDEPLMYIRDKIADKNMSEQVEAQSAKTIYQNLATIELNLSTGKYPTSRYSFALLSPKTGRKHQLRRHMNHLAHPIIGDTTHGDLRHNKLYLREFGINRLMLHAYSMTFIHPVTDDQMIIKAPLDSLWITLLTSFGWKDALEHL